LAFRKPPYYPLLPYSVIFGKKVNKNNEFLQFLTKFLF
jgi:hypothetical protein